MLNLVRRLWGSWATRSLAMGALATVIDVGILVLCVQGFGLSNPLSAMIGVTIGATFTFFANRQFAFRDHRPQLGPQAVKFAIATGSSMFIHGGLVWLLADRWGLNVVLAKLVADILVFSVGQLFLLRYLVFPKDASLAAEAATSTLAPAAGLAAEVGAREAA